MKTLRQIFSLSFILSLMIIVSTVRLVDAQPSPADTIRFLEQSTFGPTSDLIAHIQQISFEAFLDEQAAAPMTNYPDLPFWPQTRPTSCTGDCQRDNYTLYPLQRHFFANALFGQDQLRQRVAFALGQILVTSAVDVPLPSWMRGYQQLLYAEAFGNFRQLLYDVTLNPTMGRFLDMLNNRCQTRTPPDVNVCRNGLKSQPNENYAREILQLFSIGTFVLNQDGTRALDGSGNPIPTYDQKTVEEFARVFTGWVLAPALPGPPEVGGTVPNYRDPMVLHKDSQGREDYHDRGPKTLLNGAQLPGGQAADQELNAAIDNIADHPNVAPFISKQLIQHLVTSNPSTAYVQRIASVFVATRTSATQFFEVVRAILLDDEARGDSKDPSTLPSYGKLREPVQFHHQRFARVQCTKRRRIGLAERGRFPHRVRRYESGCVQCAVRVQFLSAHREGARGKRARPAVCAILVPHFLEARQLRQQSDLFNHPSRAAESAQWHVHRPLGLDFSR